MNDNVVSFEDAQIRRDKQCLLPQELDYLTDLPELEEHFELQVCAALIIAGWIRDERVIVQLHGGDAA